MTYAVKSRHAAAAQPGPARLAADLLSAMRALVREITGAWRYAIARREFNALDASTLRDLGMSRSEFDSYWAETHGMAEQTRARVVDS
jgi:uncharacterized protein YjiS (DUF1127 family)